jgi:radical SAM superfamily enzyme with C-terminal helix-hairpin-helix motif
MNELNYKCIFCNEVLFYNCIQIRSVDELPKEYYCCYNEKCRFFKIQRGIDCVEKYKKDYENKSIIVKK